MRHKITIKSDPPIEFEADEEETILDAALDNDVDFPFSCFSGICTTCKGRVLTGEITYGNNQPDAIDPDESAQGYALFCSAYARSDCTISHPELSDELSFANETTYLKAYVTARDSLGADTTRITLKPESPLHYAAGQYIQLRLNDELYPFSIANPPGDDNIELHIQTTNTHPNAELVLQRLPLNQQIEFTAPAGEVRFAAHSNKLLLIAGGSGYSQTNAILEHALRSGLASDIYVYWGVRDPKWFYHGAQIRAWEKITPNLHFIPVVSEPHPNWDGRVGLVHQAVLEDFSDLSDFEAYLSGPFNMSFAAREDFVKANLPTERIYSDAFGFES